MLQYVQIEELIMNKNADKSIEGLVEFLHKKVRKEHTKYGGSSLRSVELNNLYKNVDSLLALINEYRESDNLRRNGI